MTAFFYDINSQGATLFPGSTRNEGVPLFHLK